MKIKNLEQAEELPMKSSMRKSSGYDSWECNHHYGRGINAWTIAFVEKNVGNTFNSTYSAYKKALSKKHLSQKYYEEMIWYFKSITNYHEHRYRYWPGDVYIDEDGILQKKERKHKNRDRIINYGEPEYRYYFDKKYLYLEPILVKVFGWRKTWEFTHTGFHESKLFGELPQEYNPDVRRFNNLCRENDIKESKYSWCHLTFYDLWTKWVRYSYTETYKYRSPGYYRLHYEGKSLRHKYERERAQELVDKFNRIELNVNKRPILID